MLFTSIDVSIGQARSRGRLRLAVKAIFQKRQFRNLEDADLSELDDDDNNDGTNGDFDMTDAYEPC